VPFEGLDRTDKVPLSAFARAAMLISPWPCPVFPFTSNPGPLSRTGKTEIAIHTIERDGDE
jgi:hypothetical protein